MIKGRRSCVDNLMSGVALAETRMRTSIHPPVAPRPLIKEGDFLNQQSATQPSESRGALTGAWDAWKISHLIQHRSHNTAVVAIESERT
jgi:hypothetical protein